jgi:cation-transporting P-type ATPase 13A2
VCWEVFTAKTNEIHLRSLTEGDMAVNVIRSSRINTINSADLVIGDVVVLDSNFLHFNSQVPCDMILLQGEVVVNESSLTGEILPVLKAPLLSSNDVFHIERHKYNVLYGGSKLTQITTLDGNVFNSESEQIESKVDDSQKMSEILDIKQCVLAVVYATGFASTKGELFRSILYPTEIEFKFNKDAVQFLFILGSIALIAFIDRLINTTLGGYSLIYILINSLDVITIAVPPALPLVLTVGVGISLQRLKKKEIFCINPDRLNHAGRILSVGIELEH